MGEVRVGIIGSGRIARTHAAAYKTVARGRLTACTDAIPESARTFAAENGLKVFDSMEAIGADELVSRLASDSVTLLDVRPADEYRAGHLPSARNITLEELRAVFPGF